MYARAWARRAWIEHGNGLLKEHVGVLSSKVHAATVVMNRIKKARMCNAADDTRLVWVDLEMTGLEVDTDHIIEMACLITDGDLTIIAEGPNLIIHQPEEILSGMNDWCKEHHGKSGLTQAVLNSKISLQQAEMEMVSFVRQHTPQGRCPLAGNTVHADKRFLDKYMPHFMNHLHYRIVDVSTIKELCRRWYPQEYRHAPSKAASHRALDDIRESIKELEFYRKAVFKPDESSHQSNCT